MLVLDTAALFYWTLDPVQLTPSAQQAIATADRLLISSMSIWEIGLKVKKGRLEIPIDFADYVAGLKKLDRLEIYAVDEEIWMKNLDLDWNHADPADRTIVATAVLFNCPLVTPDREIRRFYGSTLW
jgi:PIN domain nuclease of toxin-antitoxin system